MARQGLFKLLLLILACWAVRNDAVPKCDKVPEGTTAPKSRADNRFTLEILGKPQTYSPGEMYTEARGKCTVCDL